MLDMVRPEQTLQIREGRLFAGDAERIGPAKVTCPKCKANVLFVRGANAFFDASGFESYLLKCDGCGADISVIVDPHDEAFLLSRAED
ncbi:MAG TPA: hypothetical protein VGG11_19120 [Xanthobacteraceae bacterium]|jgi:hypothetical protein